MASYEISYNDPQMKPYRVAGVVLNTSGALATFRDLEGRITWVFRLDGRNDHDPKEIARLAIADNAVPGTIDMFAEELDRIIDKHVTEIGDCQSMPALTALLTALRDVIDPQPGREPDRPLKQKTFDS